MVKLRQISVIPENVESTLRNIVEKIVGNFDVDRIILFGSYAYGKVHGHSDIDLFIVMKSKEKPNRRIIKLSRLFRNREFPIDFIIKTPEELKERLSLGVPFCKNFRKRKSFI